MAIIALRAVSGRAAGIVRTEEGGAAFSLRSVSTGRAHLFLAGGQTVSQELTRTVSGASARIRIQGRILGAAVTDGERVLLIGAAGVPLNGIWERARQIAAEEKQKKEAELLRAEEQKLPEPPGQTQREQEETQQEEEVREEQAVREECEERAAALARLTLAQNAEQPQEDRPAGLFANAFPRIYPRVNWQIVERSDGSRLLRTFFMGRRLLAYPSAAMAVPPAGLPGHARYAVARSGQGYWIMEE